MDINQTVWYHIVNANTNSNRMLEVPDVGDVSSRLRDGAFIMQGDEYNPSDQSPWSLWHFVHIGGGKYHIFNKGSGRCMVMENGWTNDGARPWQYSVIGERPQEQWTITDVPDGSGNAYIKNVNSGLYLEIQNSGTHKGDICQQWDNNGQSGARWQLKPTTLPTVPDLSSGKVSIDGNVVHRNAAAEYSGQLIGDNVVIGSTIVAKNGPHVWKGLVHDNGFENNVRQFKFKVKYSVGNPAPIQDNAIPVPGAMRVQQQATVTVTVTNTAGQSSQSTPTDPPASDVP